VALHASLQRRKVEVNAGHPYPILFFAFFSAGILIRKMKMKKTVICLTYLGGCGTSYVTNAALQV